MLPAVIAAVEVTALAFALPEKAIVVGPPLTRGRRAMIRFARNTLNTAQKRHSLDEVTLHERREDVRLLQRGAHNGWSSDREFVALGKVAMMVAGEKFWSVLNGAWEALEEALPPAGQTEPHRVNAT